MVEIARAVKHNAEVIIFDEPTSSLTPEEKRHFFALMRRLKQRGVSIVFISHALEEALAHSDRITILRDGERVVTNDTSQFDRDTVIRAMVGRSLSTEIYKARRTANQLRQRGEKVLSVQDISMGNLVRNTSFSIYDGQITGVFGLIGSGRTETFKIVSGIYKRDFLRRRRRRAQGPQRALPRAGAGREGRHRLCDRRTARPRASSRPCRSRRTLFRPAGRRPREGSPYVSRREMRTLAGEWSGKLNIRAITDNAKVIELSGGNQQKVVIGKGLVQKPRIVIFDEPTRGVDVGAIAEIHHFINALRGRRPRRRGDLLLPAGDHEPLRPHPRLPPGPHRRGALAGGCDGGEDHVRGGALAAGTSESTVLKICAARTRLERASTSSYLTFDRARS